MLINRYLARMLKHSNGTLAYLTWLFLRVELTHVIMNRPDEYSFSFRIVYNISHIYDLFRLIKEIRKFDILMIKI
jgi:hypothetical protein